VLGRRSGPAFSVRAQVKYLHIVSCSQIN